ncbi:cellulose binding domain-containing protein [Streptomyces sp. NPDC001380]|uniref:cellulose binding domain-containing protein n=1 Tax=Streptomyces sp. NPDC001380 TaxID=3364566 RepID=UPI0036C432DB
MTPRPTAPRLAPHPPDGARRTACHAVLAAAAACLLAAAALLPPPARAAASGCTVAYTVDRWAGGYTAQVRVANLGPSLDGWRLTWTHGAGERVTNAWNASVVQSGRTVTATAPARNASLPAGGSAGFGLQGTWSTAGPPPAGFALDGVRCNGAADPAPAPTGTGDVTAARPPTPAGDPATPVPEPGCGTAVVCSGFEDQSGPVPGGDWQVVTPDCQGSGTVSIDASTAHGGTRSLRVDGRAGYCNHVFAGTTRDVSAVGPVLHARLWVRHATALPASRVTAITLSDASDGGRDLRIGGRNGALQWSRESDDATLPEQGRAGAAPSRPLPTGRWVCLRFALDTVRQAARTWVDDAEVPGLRVDGTSVPGAGGRWPRRGVPPRPVTFRLGWESYGGGDDTLWFDDVAVGP